MAILKYMYTPHTHTHTHTHTLLAWCEQNYKAPDDQPDEYQTIPLEKIEDFGVHCRQ